MIKKTGADMKYAMLHILTTFEIHKRKEFNHWASFSPQGRGLGTSLGLWSHNSVSSSDFGSNLSDRPGLRNSNVRSDFTASAYNSRLRGVGTFLISDSNLLKV